jgi:hypothetical protein
MRTSKIYIECVYPKRDERHRQVDVNRILEMTGLLPAIPYRDRPLLPLKVIRDRRWPPSA